MRGAAGAAAAVRVGGLVAPRRATLSPELVPRGYLHPSAATPAATSPPPMPATSDLKWLLQKLLLAQDVFLPGAPGAERRQLALAFCELINAECEIVTLSRDTNEADLKQRREIVDGSAVYTDQAPVRAALNGRILILDGIEKAERNVLPTLNNLLENREMALADGRFLVEASRYDALRATLSAEELAERRLERVSEDFQIIALGLPVPAFQGFPLDPPLRSRFQARALQSADAPTLMRELTQRAGAGAAAAACVDPPSIASLVGFSTTLAALRGAEDAPLSGAHKLPHLPPSAVRDSIDFLKAFPNESVADVLQLYFPSKLFQTLDTERAGVVDAALSRFSLRAGTTVASETAASDGDGSDGAAQMLPAGAYDLISSAATDSQEGAAASPMTTLRFAPCSADAGCNDAIFTLPTPSARSTKCVSMGTPIHSEFEPTISLMAQLHALGKDFCVVANAGEGKSTLVHEFAARLGLSAPEILFCFEDMSSRDLLQRRDTDASGNTVWRQSLLVDCALDGKLVVLDGLHRLTSDSIAVLASLMNDRELHLFDGTRLLRHDRYDALVRKTEGGRDALTARGVRRIAETFRIVALAPPPERGSEWLTSETVAMMPFIQLPAITPRDKVNLVARHGGDVGGGKSGAEKMLSVVEMLDELQGGRNVQTQLAGMQLSLSVRQIKRLWRTTRGGSDQLRQRVESMLLQPFMSQPLREALDGAFDAIGIFRSASQLSMMDANAHTIEFVNDKRSVRIGTTTLPVAQNVSHPELIPAPLFYDVPAHVAILDDMASDIDKGERYLLLIGNQGTGKNKLADRFCELLSYEREYMQLHRDTNVQSLTATTGLVDGVIISEDSPLVEAAVHGRLLMLDEADKAPTEVVCILKGLIEDGFMLLGDGRRLVAPNSAAAPPSKGDSKVLAIHPNFKMIVLANRPGFPFLGNDFASHCGDAFSTHIVANPDEASQQMLLREYASSSSSVTGSGEDAVLRPVVSDAVIARLTSSFTELKDLHEGGVLHYPFSTREMVGIVRHLDAYPRDGLARALDNVLAFERHSAHTLRVLCDVFERHGIPTELPRLEEGAREVQSGGEEGTHDITFSGGDAGGQAAVSLATEHDVHLVEAPIAVTLEESVPCETQWRGQLRARNASYLFGQRKEIEHDNDHLSAARTTRFTEEVSRFAVAEMVGKSDAKASRNATNSAAALAISGTVGNDVQVLVQAGSSMQLHTYQADVHGGGAAETHGSLVDISGVISGTMPSTIGSARAAQSEGGDEEVLLHSLNGGVLHCIDPTLRESLSCPLAPSFLGESAATSVNGRSGPAWLRYAQRQRSGTVISTADVRSSGSIGGEASGTLVAWHGSDVLILDSQLRGAQAGRYEQAPAAASGGALASDNLFHPQRSSALGGGSAGPLQHHLTLPNGIVPSSLWNLSPTASIFSDDVEGLWILRNDAAAASSSVSRIRGIDEYVGSHGRAIVAVHPIGIEDVFLQFDRGEHAGVVLRGLLGGDTRVQVEDVVVVASDNKGGESTSSTFVRSICTHTEDGGDARIVTIRNNPQAVEVLHLSSSSSDKLTTSTQHVIDLEDPLLGSPQRRAATDGIDLENDALVDAAFLGPRSEHAAVLSARGAVRVIQVGLQRGGAAAERMAREAREFEEMMGDGGASSAGGGPQEGEDGEGSDGAGRIEYLSEDGDVVDSPFDDEHGASNGGGGGGDLDEESGGGGGGSGGSGEGGGGSGGSGGSGEGGGGGAGGGGGEGAGGSGGGGGGGGGGDGADLSSSGDGGYSAALHQLLSQGDDGAARNDAKLDWDETLLQADDGDEYDEDEDARALLEENLRAVRKESRIEELDEDGKPISSYAGEAYAQIIEPLSHLIVSMRSLLEGAEARERERTWLTGKLQGELDDQRLVDAVAGERAVFKMRGEPEQEHGHEQQLPKRISFALDASASMARMNAWDGRLDRLCETVAVLMETLGPLEHKWEYQLRVHSGSTDDKELATFGKPPLTSAAKLDVIRTLQSHARGAQSGDHSLECLQRCIKDVALEESDDALVVLFSDANLGRYGISPSQIGDALATEPDVSSFCVFIGEPTAAEWIAQELPIGRGYVVLDTKTLPLCVADILGEAAAR